MAIKNATGYNLSAVVAGSRGTLGVLLEVILRLVPKPAARSIGMVRFWSRTPGFAAARSLSDAALGVDALEVDSPLDADTMVLVLEVEDAAAGVAEKRLNRLLARSIDLVGIVDDRHPRASFPAESTRLTWRSAVEPRRFADACTRLVARAQERGIGGWLRAEATGGALELATPADDVAIVEEIGEAAGIVDHSRNTSHLRLAVQRAFDPAGRLRAL